MSYPTVECIYAHALFTLIFVHLVSNRVKHYIHSSHMEYVHWLFTCGQDKQIEQSVFLTAQEK